MKSRRPNLRSLLVLGLVLGLVTTAHAAPDEAPAGASKKARSEFERLSKPGLAREKAPDQFRVEFDTTKGKIIVEVDRAWAPHGADRFYNLVRLGSLSGHRLLPRHRRIHGAVRDARESEDQRGLVPGAHSR